MYQTFTSVSRPSDGAVRVARLRSRFKRLRVAAFLVPRSDEHMGEYVAPSAERLGWLTGFTGSAGLAVIATTQAAVFVDGRYTLQARAQVDAATFEIVQVPETEAADWLMANVPAGSRIGYDPWLHPRAAIARLEERLGRAGLTLRALSANPVDAIWGADRPLPPVGGVIVHRLTHAGVSGEHKIRSIQAQLKAAKEDAVVLTLPDSIAWLLNIRGADVQHNPTALAFAIVHAGARPELFIDRRKLDAAARDHLTPLVRLRAPEAFEERLDALRVARRRVRLDIATTAMAIWQRLGGKAGHISEGTDPCQLPKARKNETEIHGARTAHQRDGAVMARFLAWLDREAPKGTLDEIAVARRLEEMRAETQALKEISFDTISGAGPNGAIVHYRVNEASCRRLQAGELYLVDSGAQFVDGTTDITRTVAIGEPTREMRERYTLVLKGHIALATVRFPAGTTGAHLDAFARRPLWEHGLDYDHGTGHGVGSYLSVHEGPQSISKRGHVALEAGMIVSNEPGYYKTGAYGIRIENLLLVSEAMPIARGERAMLGFETLTLAPFDRRLIDTTLLSGAEVAWIDAYHARVGNLIGPALGAVDRAWLGEATKKLPREE